MFISIFACHDIIGKNALRSKGLCTCDGNDWKFFSSPNALDTKNTEEPKLTDYPFTLSEWNELALIFVECLSYDL